MNSSKATREPETALNKSASGPIQYQQLTQVRHLATDTAEPTAEQTAALEAENAKEAAIIAKAEKAVSEKFARQLNGISASVRTLTEGFTKLSTPKEPKEEGTEGKIKELQAQIAAQQQSANERIAQAETKERNSAIKAVIPSGIGEKKAKILFNHVIAEHGKDIKVENGEVIFDDPVRGTKSTLSELMDEILSGPDGDMFKTAPGAGADTRGLGNRSTTQGGTSRIEDMSREEIEKGLSTPEGRERLYKQAGKEMGR